MFLRINFFTLSVRLACDSQRHERLLGIRYWFTSNHIPFRFGWPRGQNPRGRGHNPWGQVFRPRGRGLTSLGWGSWGSLLLDVGSSSLLAGFVRSGTGWEWSCHCRDSECFQDKAWSSLKEHEGVFIGICFFLLPMAIHDSIFMDGSW